AAVDLNQHLSALGQKRKSCLLLVHVRSTRESGHPVAASDVCYGPTAVIGVETCLCSIVSVHLNDLNEIADRNDSVRADLGPHTAPIAISFRKSRLASDCGRDVAWPGWFGAA